MKEIVLNTQDLLNGLLDGAAAGDYEDVQRPLPESTQTGREVPTRSCSSNSGEEWGVGIVRDNAKSSTYSGVYATSKKIRRRRLICEHQPEPSCCICRNLEWVLLWDASMLDEKGYLAHLHDHPSMVGTLCVDTNLPKLPYTHTRAYGWV